MAESISGDEHRWVIALVLLAFTTGLVDAASVLGLGHVFTGNMTGNLLFVGFSLAGAQDVSISASLLAVAGFVTGAAAGSRIARASRGCRTGFAIELSLLTAALALAAMGSHAALRDQGLLILLAAALGIQGAIAREIHGERISTVVLTSTLIAATADLASDDLKAQTVQRVSAIGAMVAGAVVGALLLHRGPGWPIGLGALLVATVLSLSWRAP